MSSQTHADATGTQSCDLLGDSVAIVTHAHGSPWSCPYVRYSEAPLPRLRQRTQEFRGELHLTNLNPGTRVEVVIPCGDNATTVRGASASALQLDQIGA